MRAIPALRLATSVLDPLTTRSFTLNCLIHYAKLASQIDVPTEGEATNAKAKIDDYIAVEGGADDHAPVTTSSSHSS
ncbi:hypothetical protein Ancab_012742 [Ancistrocladus abbreviatus]